MKAIVTKAIATHVQNSVKFYNQSTGFVGSTPTLDAAAFKTLPQEKVDQIGLLGFFFVAEEGKLKKGVYLKIGKRTAIFMVKPTKKEKVVQKASDTGYEHIRIKPNTKVYPMDADIWLSISPCTAAGSKAAIAAVAKAEANERVNQAIMPKGKKAKLLTKKEARKAAAKNGSDQTPYPFPTAASQAEKAAVKLLGGSVPNEH
jgi:hypothetical protein